MKIKPLIIIASVLFLGIVSAVIITNWNKHIIYLSSGDFIEAGKTWVVFDEVYYEKGEGTLFTIKTDAVEEIVSAGFSSFYDWKMILLNEMASRRGVFRFLMNKMTWFAVLVLLGMIGAVGLMQFVLSKKSRVRDQKEDTVPSFRIPVSSAASDSEKVVLFFLNIFLLQVGAKRSDRYHYRQTDIKGPLNTTVHEFRVNIDGQWQVRRMSLGRIGEDSGARSKCFYVIYDDHYVIKIPPEPVTDFNFYIESIRADRQIADLLAPRECLVPKVSIILKQIPACVTAMGKNTIANEQLSIEGLKNYSKFQQFLNLGGSFAFFMDLSKHFFLGSILADCHDTAEATTREIHDHQDLIWTPGAFSDRYGEDAAELCFKLGHVYEEFDRQFTATAVASFQKKAWFTAAFLDNEGSAASNKIPGNALITINKLKISHKEILDEYRSVLDNFTRGKFFKQNSVKIKNISSRLIELLSWLFFKHVAIRDLKPDNLLVAGDPSKYPHFLNTADGFEIGLIDVEIAVHVDPENDIAQPKLGWTPFYATPSHLFVNEVLKEMYEDVRYIFFLQDWYAAVAIIYEAVTGEKLFVKTAAVLVRFSRELERYYGDFSKMKLFAQNSGKQFWQEAAQEFELKMRQKEELFQSIQLDLSRNVKKMFKAIPVKNGRKAIKRQLIEINSGITAGELLILLFAHIRDVMDAKIP